MKRNYFKTYTAVLFVISMLSVFSVSASVNSTGQFDFSGYSDLDSAIFSGSLAIASDGSWWKRWWKSDKRKATTERRQERRKARKERRQERRERRQVPELSPTSAVSALALLLGLVALFREKRRRQQI